MIRFRRWNIEIFNFQIVMNLSGIVWLWDAPRLWKDPEKSQRILEENEWSMGQKLKFLGRREYRRILKNPEKS